MGAAGAVAVRGRAAPTRQFAPAPTRPPVTAQPVVAPAIGNRAMGSLLGTLTVQRSSCGGACGCGGTCGGEQEKQEEAAVQRLPMAVATTGRTAPPAVRSAVGALQTGAGNAAVARLLSQQRGGPTPEAAVQRLGVEDLLPDWISGAIFGAKDKAAAGAAKAQKDGQELERSAERQADEATGKVDAEIPKLAAEATKTHSRAEEKMASGNQTVAKGKADLDKATAKAAKDLEQTAAKTQQANTGKQLMAGEQPSCSLTKVMNSAEKVADLIGKPFGIKGAELLRKLGGIVSKIGSNIKKGLELVGKFVTGVKNAYNAADTWVKNTLGTDLATIGKWAIALSNPITAMSAIGKWVAGKVVDSAIAAGKRLASLASWAAKEGPALLASVKSKVGSWFSKLPSPLISAINAIAAPFTGVLGPLMAAGQALAEKLKPKADASKAKAEQAAKDATAKKDEIESKAKADKAKKEAELKAKKDGEAAKTDAKGKEAAEGPKKEGEEKVGALKKAGEEEADKLSHKVCAELDSSAGQCIADYLPDPGGKKGNASAITATVSGEVTIPIPDTPLSAKVGQGSKVEVARTGTKSYTVSITGDAMLYVNAGVGNAGATADVKVDLPGGGKGNPGKVWEKLKGGGAPAPTPAPAGGTPAATDDTYKGDLDVGYRAQTALVYGFTAGETNCQGLGGLVTLLGVLGVKGGGGFLGELAMLGADEAFEKNLQSRKFTIAEGVVMSGEIKNEMAKAGVKVSGEAGVTIGQEKDDSGKMVDVLEVFIGGAGELTGEIDAGIVSGIGGGIAGSGKVTLSLGYVKDEKAGTEEIKVTKLKGELSATASVAASNLGKIGEVAGPAVVAEIKKALQIDKANIDPTMASLTGAAAGEVDPAVVRKELGPILSDPEAASLAALKTAGGNIIKDKKTAGSASLTMTLSERLAGVGVEAEERSAEMRVGAKASATLDRSETRVLWSTSYP